MPCPAPMRIHVARQKEWPQWSARQWRTASAGQVSGRLAALLAELARGHARTTLWRIRVKAAGAGEPELVANASTASDRSRATVARPSPCGIHRRWPACLVPGLGQPGVAMWRAPHAEPFGLGCQSDRVAAEVLGDVKTNGGDGIKRVIAAQRNCLHLLRHHGEQARVGIGVAAAENFNRAGMSALTWAPKLICGLSNCLCKFCIYRLLAFELDPDPACVGAPETRAGDLKVWATPRSTNWVRCRNEWRIGPFEMRRPWPEFERGRCWSR